MHKRMQILCSYWCGTEEEWATVARSQRTLQSKGRRERKQKKELKEEAEHALAMAHRPGDDATKTLKESACQV